MPSKVFRYSKLPSQFILAVVILLLVIGCRQSNPIPAEIVGDSMAPLLCGAHLSQCCPECDFAFLCRSGKDVKSVHCSNCGSQFAAQGETLPADRVSVTPDSSPQRWDIVAFEHNGNTMIKRLVGLPGETVVIAGGNVLIDGNVSIKPAEIMKQTQHLVFDSKYQNPTASPHLVAKPDASIEWANYRHQQNYPHTDAAPAPDWPAIQDDNSYNQNVGRKLNNVHELAVQLDLQVRQGARFKLQRTLPQGTYLLTFEVDQNSAGYKGALSRGKAERTFSGNFSAAADRPFEVSLLFSNIDGRINVALDEEVLINVPEKFGGQQIPSDVTAPYLKFGFSTSSTGTVNRCRVWRDIHYFAQAAPPKFQLPQTLGEGEYFVLGDNVAVSRDSRNFGPIKKVIGIVQQ